METIQGWKAGNEWEQKREKPENNFSSTIKRGKSTEDSYTKKSRKKSIRLTLRGTEESKEKRKQKI